MKKTPSDLGYYSLPKFFFERMDHHWGIAAAVLVNRSQIQKWHVRISITFWKWHMGYQR